MTVSRGDASQTATPDTIKSLISELRTHDWRRREGARWALVALKEAATAALVDTLEDRDWHARWEAAKALGEIADPKAGPALVEALKDRRFAVRWLAAEGLIALRADCLRPLLRSLARNADSLWLRGGAHHILRDLSEGHLSRELTDIVKPVLAALEHPEPSLEVPVAASAALEALPRTRRGRRG
jgi:HEAT repeat protein